MNHLNCQIPNTRVFRLLRNLSCLGSLAACTLSGNAQLVVTLPNLDLLPNTPNQTFELFIQNGGSPVAVSGIVFTLQVADGNSSFTTPPGTIDGPDISAGDILTGTIFANNNTEQGGEGTAIPQIFQADTTTANSTVNILTGSSKLASVTFDTTGFSSGVFSYTLNSPATDVAPLTYLSPSGDIFPTTIDGTLTVVPEPSHYALAFGVACIAWGAYSRRSKARAAA